MSADNAGSVSDYTTPREPAGVWVQYKNTHICMDFWCSCDPDFLGHLDAYHAYAVKCPRCGQVYEMQQTLRLYPVGDTKFTPVLIRDDDD